MIFQIKPTRKILSKYSESKQYDYYQHELGGDFFKTTQLQRSLIRRI